MATLQIGAQALQTHFAIPTGKAADILAHVDRQAWGLARARLAAACGLPDPFHIRAALCAAPDAHVIGTEGAPLTADAMDALLLSAGGADCAGLVVGRRLGPRVRALSPPPAALRWPTTTAPPPKVGDFQRWTMAELGENPVSTVRCCVAIPGGVALGSDYGLLLWRDGRFAPFPWPAGARRENRRVEAMVVHDEHLYVATSQSLFCWDFGAEVTNRKHGRDDEDGWDDLNALESAGGRLLIGWRTRFEGGDGPPDVISMAADPAGVVYAGTRDGRLFVIDGGGPIRVFGDHKGRPIRHLAFAQGALWVAAHGALHRFDGHTWTTAAPEPTAFAVDAADRLWALAEGKLHVLQAGQLTPIPLPIDRPWSLAATPDTLWIGGREWVGRLVIQ